MSRTGPITRFRTLDGGQRAQLARATIAMSLSSAAVACLPFRRAIRFGAVPVSSVSPQRVEGWRWAVEAVSRRLPWRTMCIEKGLALQRLLRRSGVDARLHYGARHHPIHGELQAHVWITVDDRAIIGGDEAAGFAEVACYP